mmetsp:Transcript_15186/g.39242  ORF Transcript_15186/g.39242 Transcript_15186/m.39242 type:complete len:276 (-) Transcript_15186:250-1077(-)|eukprot:CAMPEP_0115862812 /NCGR_PEP_ID=MMETSP0287-20121206/18372_1 /TAXON_ID=412157 /ORGANISM="Chrysochromulina rotalis, Strain UIO044" /LENGTH=275 /DNA_ID=CAMNT_0003317251 /DNA_START=12 /DNA_END=839 /DNA_ORIENTATION=+
MASAKLAAALRKNADDDDAPRPPVPPPSAPTVSSSQLKLRKSNLLGVVTWEEMSEKLDLNNKHEYATCVETMQKMLGNVLANPSEPKYRKIRSSNPNFVAKVYSCKGAPELFQLAGFKDTVEEGFLVLPDATDLAPLQKAINTLASHVATRKEKEEKKLKLDQERARKAREDRAQKAQEEAMPAAYDAAIVGQQAMMIDEDETMNEAIEAFMEMHSDLKAGRSLDSYAIERQVAGPGGTVVVSVAASAGTEYFDYTAIMKRGEGGQWAVVKIEAT